MFRETAMPKRPRTSSNHRAVPVLRDAGWTVRGDLQFTHDDDGAVPDIERLAKRFVVEAHGHWKTTVARPANAIGLSMIAGGFESELHTHEESQLLYVVRGEVTCEAANALWIVPPSSALWIRSQVIHKIRARAPLEAYSLFLVPDAAPHQARDCGSVFVTPLLRELLLRLATRPAHYDLEGPDARLVSVLLDELAASAIENHRLPMPADPRLRRLADAMIAHPADNATMTTWAKRVGASERTLHRLLVQETGLSFGRWRQQLHIVLALQQLSRGAKVQSVATDLGYESASSFVTMFGRLLGASPARYMAQRLGLAPRGADSVGPEPPGAASTVRRGTRRLRR